MLLGPVIYLTGGVLVQYEIARGQDRHREMLASLSDGLDEGDLSQTLEMVKGKSSAALSHWSRTTYYSCAVYLGFTLFLLGIALFLIGGRRRSLAAMPNRAGLQTGAEPSDRSVAAGDPEGRGQ